MSEENNSDNSKRTSEQEGKIHILFENAMIALQATETKKQEIIRQLARDLENHGMLAETISEEITKVLSAKGYASEQYIRRCLEDKYKSKGKQRKKNVIEESEPKRAELLQEKQEVIEISTQGNPIRDDPPENNTKRDFKKVLDNIRPEDQKNEILELTEDYKIESKRLQEQIKVLKEKDSTIEYLKDQNQTKDLRIGQLEEANESLTNQLKEMSIAMNNFTANKKENTKVEDTVEYQSIKSQLLIVTEERDELRQLVSMQMKENPSQTFQSADKLGPGMQALISATGAAIPNEVEFPARDLSTMFLDSKNAKQIMYLKIDGNKVVNWESDYKRERKR